MDYREVAPGQYRVQSPLDDVNAAAMRMGMTAELTDSERGGARMFGITVERKADDWSMPPTEIAIARTIDAVSTKALAAIKAMMPQIQAKLDAASPEPPDPREERIAVALERIAAALESMVADDD